MKNTHSNIAMLTTVINFDFYNKTVNLFPENIPYYIIDGRNGMHGIHSLFYAFKKLKNKGIEWLIMADEDVIFQNAKSVFGIIDFMKNNKYTVCGVRDGGVIDHRNNNPHLINTFFSIINFKEVSNYFNKKEILKNQYVIEGEFKDEFYAPFKYDSQSLYEPYYCFYFWLRRKGVNILFLEAEMYGDDQLSNTVMDHFGETFLIHTWHARSYGINKKHTQRINRILNETKIEIKQHNKIYVLRSKTFVIVQKFKKLQRRFSRYFKLIQ
ncbi:hypothetical protein [Aequorivita flava]|uniref:Glycosyl transferase family 2 n=1 Tax=Aequorivita flava TaxID=3114371 RepID=A0AB35YSP2_9FLAO